MQLSKKYLKWLSVSYWRKRERQLIKVNNKLDRFLYLLEYNELMAEKELHYSRPSLGLKRHCNDEESL